MLHQHGRQRGNFDGSVPAVHVIAGVGLGNTNGTRVFQRLLKGLPVFHAANKQVRAGIQHAREAFQFRQVQILAKKREDGRAIHDG